VAKIFEPRANERIPAAEVMVEKIERLIGSDCGESK
jgi:hypothetical protein